MRMSEESKARQRAANAQSDNIVDTDRTHHDGIPRDPEIVSFSVRVFSLRSSFIRELRSSEDVDN